jgi:hypothetical protein
MCNQNTAFSDETLCDRVWFEMKNAFPKKEAKTIKKKKKTFTKWKWKMNKVSKK